jgi:hypothetical protein
VEGTLFVDEKRIRFTILLNNIQRHDKLEAKSLEAILLSIIDNL